MEGIVHHIYSDIICDSFNVWGSFPFLANAVSHAYVSQDKKEVLLVDFCVFVSPTNQIMLGNKELRVL